MPWVAGCCNCSRQSLCLEFYTHDFAWVVHAHRHSSPLFQNGWAWPACVAKIIDWEIQTLKHYLISLISFQPPITFPNSVIIHFNILSNCTKMIHVTPHLKQQTNTSQHNSLFPQHIVKFNLKTVSLHFTDNHKNIKIL